MVDAQDALERPEPSGDGEPESRPAEQSAPVASIEADASVEHADAAAERADALAAVAGAEGDASPATDGGDATAPEHAEEGGAESEGEQAAGVGGASRRRRRRKPKKDVYQGPLARFLAGPGGVRRHVFAAGEVVAGRVLRAEEGVVAVDLFGKATAFADEHEPREAPPLPEPPSSFMPSAEGATPATEAGAGATGGAVAGAVETEQAEGASASAEASQVASDEASQVASDEASQVAGEAPVGSAEAALVEVDEAASDDARLAEAAEAATAEDEASREGEGAEGEGTEGAEAHAAHGPLAPAPIVPESFPRLEPAATGKIFRGRVGAVSESGHVVIVNRIVDAAAVRVDLDRYRTERRRVQGLVFGFNRGGFDVLVAGIRAFCPVRLMALEEIDDPESFVGRRMEFLLPPYAGPGRDVVVSRRSILEREQRKRAREFVRTLAPGQRFQGRVTQVFEFGLLVDIGGAEGLVHQSELSWAHAVRPADVAVPGDTVEVQVLRVGDPGGRRPAAGRRDRLERIGLSIKALQPDPWTAHAAALGEGSVQKGKVTRVTEFGAFIELAPAIEGLLHVTELGRDVRHAGDVLKEGEEIDVIIEHVDPRARRISLSKLTASELEDHKQGRLGGPDAPKSLRPGTRLKVKIEKLEHRGLLVRVAGVAGRRARGYLPKSELAGEKDGDHRRAFPVGSEIEVQIVGFDREGGLKCSVKALQFDDERRAVRDYRRETSKQGFGTFGDLLRAKLGETTK